MIRHLRFLAILIVFIQFQLIAQLPSPALVGYFHNWNDGSAPYIQLNAVDPRYNVIDIAFAVPQTGTDYQMTFTPSGASQAVFISQIQALKAQGKKVILSIGGATSAVSLDNTNEKNVFIASMDSLINLFEFDGLDIDLEGSSVSVSGGTISNPTDAKIINLIAAIKQIMSDYRTTFNKKMLLTMAPETAYIQGGMSAYAGIWGAYLPIVDALRDSLDLLHVQLYNSGSMYGIDNVAYNQGTADFIIAMTEAVIHGFNTTGGYFTGLPASKIAVGLPACTSAGSGYITPLVVKSAIDYLRGTGSKPGSYTLSNTSGYPLLRGMMTWSINWDAVSSCGSVYEYAASYQTIFGIATAINNNSVEKTHSIYPNPAHHEIIIETDDMNSKQLSLYTSSGQKIMEIRMTSNKQMLDISGLSKGIYFIKLGKKRLSFIKE